MSASRYPRFLLLFAAVHWQLESMPVQYAAMIPLRFRLVVECLNSVMQSVFGFLVVMNSAVWIAHHLPPVKAVVESRRFERKKKNYYLLVAARNCLVVKMKKKPQELAELLS